MRFLLATLFLLLFSCAAPAPAPRGVATTSAPGSTGPRGTAAVRLAAWNVANFFDTVDDPNKDTVLTDEQWQRKLDGVADVVEALDADFLALEEVENIRCLRALNQTLATPYPFLGLIEGNDAERGIDVAFLSRLPVERVVSHRDYDLPQARRVSKNYKFSRDCLQVHLQTEPPVTLFINHFKSQLGSKKEAAAKRRVQAQGVSDIVAGVALEQPEGVEVVLGDLNDGPESWSLEPIFATTADVFAGWPEEMRASHRSKRGSSPLDHILVSPDAVSRLEDAKVWQELGGKTSDHDPVSVSVRLDRMPARGAGSKAWTKSD